MTPNLIGTIGIYASAAIATVGFAAFVVTARFWASRGGWHVFWFMLVLAWVLDLSSIAHIFGDSNGFQWVRAVTFAIGMPFVLAWRSWIIFDLQLRQHPMAYAEGRQRPAKEENAVEDN